MKKVLVIVILISILSFALATWSEPFPLGTYSQIKETIWEMDNLNVLSTYMNQLGYNSTIVQTKNHNNLNTILGVLNSNQIDAVIDDKGWSNTGSNEKYATDGLSTGNYYRFEAEYEDVSSVTDDDLLNSQYWYGSRSEDVNEDGILNYLDLIRLGSPGLFINALYPASNDYIWKCEPNPNPEVITGGVGLYRFEMEMVDLHRR